MYEETAPTSKSSARRTIHQSNHPVKKMPSSAAPIYPSHGTSRITQLLPKQTSPLCANCQSSTKSRYCRWTEPPDRSENKTPPIRDSAYALANCYVVWGDAESGSSSKVSLSEEIRMTPPPRSVGACPNSRRHMPDQSSSGMSTTTASPSIANPVSVATSSRVIVTSPNDM
ncbi:unnamed protein product [Linum trigynum]|uniref:Uncharacterized protein n=1 Tax=Linum trigynum TaxID=586398 RepID=A0AAV2GNN7_9ROSI